MRTFLQPRAGATFFHGLRSTACFRKDSLEFVFKLDVGGLYAVINALVVKQNKVVLFANWGNYFSPLDKKGKVVVAESELEKMRYACPLFYRLFEKGKRVSCVCYNGITTGLAIYVTIEEEPSITLIGNKKLWAAAEELKEYSIDLYAELLANCPLKNWKQRLPYTIKK